MADCMASTARRAPRGRPGPLGALPLSGLVGRAAAEVADRGPGVPSDEAARIFEPVYSTKQ